MDVYKVATTRKELRLLRGDTEIIAYDLLTGKVVRKAGKRQIPLWFTQRYLVPGSEIPDLKGRAAAFARPHVSRSRGCLVSELQMSLEYDSIVTPVMGATVEEIIESAECFSAYCDASREGWTGGVVRAVLGDKEIRLGKLSSGLKFYRDSKYQQNIKKFEKWLKKK